MKRLRWFWLRLTCHHNEWEYRRIYGDEINMLGHRVEMTCRKCGKSKLRHRVPEGWFYMRRPAGRGGVR